jgi:hypothetical protein
MPFCDASEFSLVKEMPNANLNINTHFGNLCRVTSDTLAYRQLGKTYDPAVIHANKLNQFGITSDDVERTLAAMCKIVREDSNNTNKQLNNLHFFTQHFDFYRITSDTEHAKKLSKDKPLLKQLNKEQVLMTKYYVHLAKGQLVKSPDTPFALYALPFDESGLSLEQANQKSTLTRFKYGKQAILKGAIEDFELAPVLVYLSRKDLESALLQGTVVVEIAGEQRVFNVHRNNGIAYDRRLPPYEQQRFWYFKQVNGILGYGKDANHKITVIPEVTFAGDIYQLGLGPLVFSKFDFKSHSEYRMAVIADTGGAFENNLYQLDYLAGSYASIEQYYEANKHMPDYIDAWIVILKSSSVYNE